MPDSYGKRQRNQVKARKATAREERRIARNQRRAQRDAGDGDAPESTDPEHTDHEDVDADLRDDAEST